MSNKSDKNKLFDSSLFKGAFKQALIKLSPAKMIKNPVMFTVWIGTIVMAAVCVWIALGEKNQGGLVYNVLVTAVLFITLLFANFAEAIAEARGKAQADSLRKTREETPAKVASPNPSEGGAYQIVSSSTLRKGDVFFCETGDIIASDGEIIEGLATIDESAITGESAPVIREAGGDKSSVTGGTKVLSDQIKVQVTTEPGESFLDKMIALVEGASRQKTPNEIALTILLAGFTLVFIIVTITLKPFADYANTPITISAFIALFVCLIPTTIADNKPPIVVGITVAGTCPWWWPRIVKSQSEQSLVPPITQPIPVTPSSEIPSPNPRTALCPSEMTFSELDNLHTKSNLQTKDICDKQTMILTGYLRSDSVLECSHTNDLKQKIETRCLKVYHHEHYNNATSFTATTEEEKQMFVDINRKLYKDGDYSIQIRATILFPKRDQYQYIDYTNTQIITYQPLKKV